MAIEQTNNRILRLDGVSKSFDGVQAVDRLSFDVPPGKITALIGPNGSGKTTVFNLITGFQRTDSGEILFCGRRITTKPPDQIARLGIVRTFQSIRLFPQITVSDNALLALQHVQGEQLFPAIVRTKAVMDEIANCRRLAEEQLTQVNLIDKRDQLAGELSHGQRRLLEISRALLMKPKLLLLDEPMAGLFPALMARVAMMLRDLKSSGMTILFVEHNVNVVMELADLIFVIDSGRLIASGTPQEIQGNQEVMRSYLGYTAKSAT